MKQSGFTLIEVSIVLIVVGILLALGLPMINALTRKAKFVESRETVKASREALAGVLVKSGTFAAAPLATSSPKTTDAWGKNLLFHADDRVWGAGKDICGVTVTGTRVKECSNDACSAFNLKENIAFIVYSNGEDADGVCTGSGVCTGGAGTCSFPTCSGSCTAGVCTGGVGTCPTCTATPGAYCTFPVWQQGAGYNSPCSYAAANPAFQYDDIVQYVTIDELRTARHCSFTITRTALPEARVASAYSAALQAYGDGSASYSWSVAGQTEGTNGCAAGSWPLAATNIGLCLNGASGVISGTPSTAGVGLHSFTVTATNANNTGASQAFSINIANRYFQDGVLIVNAVPATTLYVQRNGGTCTSTTGLNIMVYPGDTITLFALNTCAYGSRRCPTPALTYDYVLGLDSNGNANVGLTNVPSSTAACTFNGGTPY